MKGLSGTAFSFFDCLRIEERVKFYEYVSLSRNNLAKLAFTVYSCLWRRVHIFLPGFHKKRDGSDAQKEMDSMKRIRWKLELIDST